MSSESSLRRTFSLVCALTLGAGVGQCYHTVTEPLKPTTSMVTLKLKGDAAIEAINQKVTAGKDVTAAEVKQLTAYNQSVNDTKEGMGMALVGATGLLLMGATLRSRKGPGATRG